MADLDLKPVVSDRAPAESEVQPDRTRRAVGEGRRLVVEKRAPARRRAVPVLASFLIPVGLVVIGFVIFHRFGTGLSEERSQRSLAADLRQRFEESEALLASDSAAAKVPPGAPVALLRIPALGLDKIVVDGTSSTALQRGPGRHRASGAVGHIGRTVIVGRRSSYGSPFRELEKLERGDTIELLTVEGRFAYSVDRQAVTRSGDPTVLEQPTDRSEVALLTARKDDPTRWTVLTARLEGDALPGEPVPVLALDEAELSLTGDGGAWGSVLLWGEVLLVVGVVRRRMTTRWRQGTIWLLTSPILVLAAFLLYEGLDRLLAPTL